MAETFDGQDRRAFGRRRTRIHAMLLVPGRPPSPCVMRNYSLSGAMIELTEALDPPFNVKLRLYDTGDEIDCEVRHVRHGRMGVRFIGGQAGDIVAVIAGYPHRAKRPKVVEEPMITTRRVTGAELRRRLLGIGKL